MPIGSDFVAQSTDANPNRDEVGRVAAIWRYPVKSMGAESLEQVDVSWHGLAGDRRWAFVRDGLERSDFPWLTIREHAQMWRFQPSFVDPSRPDDSRTTVRAPDGEEFDVVDPALAARLGDGARVIKQNRGVFDVMPLSLITTRSIEAIGGLVGTELTFNRFRPNLLIEATGGDEFPEDDWVGAELEIGGLRMRVDQRDERCVMVNVDPVGNERNPSVLKAIARHRDSCLGVYGSTVAPGTVAVGDAVLRCA